MTRSSHSSTSAPPTRSLLLAALPLLAGSAATGGGPAYRYAARGPPAVQAREVMMWVDGNNLPNESAAAWDQFMVNFTRYMRPAVTSVALCPYTVTGNGTFGYQDISQPLCHGPPAGPEAFTGEIQERLGIPRFRTAGVKQYPLIAGCPGTAVVIGMMNSTSKRREFIRAAVDTATRHGFDGYNIDFELFGHPEDVKIYQSFLREFAEALAAVNGSLSVDIDHCCKGQNHTGYACNGPGNAGHPLRTTHNYATLVWRICM
jgi:hypothetical protein